MLTFAVARSAFMPQHPFPVPARERVGAAVYAERKRRKLSMQAASNAGDTSYTTWRKIERGEHVWSGSYFAVDQAFAWPNGRTLHAVTHGIDPREPNSKITPILERVISTLYVAGTELRALRHKDTSAWATTELAERLDRFAGDLFGILDHVESDAMSATPEVGSSDSDPKGRSSTDHLGEA